VRSKHFEKPTKSGAAVPGAVPRGAMWLRPAPQAMPRPRAMLASSRPRNQVLEPEVPPSERNSAILGNPGECEWGTLLLWLNQRSAHVSRERLNC
jgi:hypothetical protein